MKRFGFLLALLFVGLTFGGPVEAGQRKCRKHCRDKCNHKDRRCKAQCFRNLDRCKMGAMKKFKACKATCKRPGHPNPIRCIENCQKHNKKRTRRCKVAYSACKGLCVMRKRRCNKVCKKKCKKKKLLPNPSVPKPRKP